MNTKLFSVAAIMAAGAMAECISENLTCTLYTEINYGGTAQEVCLDTYLDGTVVHNLGKSFVIDPEFFA